MTLTPGSATVQTRVNPDTDRDAAGKVEDRTTV